MSYTITAAQYANIAETAAFVTTVEAGLIIISQADNPSDWADLMAWDALPGNVIDPYLTLPQLKALKIQESLTNRDATKALGAEYGGQRFDIVSQEKKDIYNRLHKQVTACKSPIGSFEITGGTSNPGTNKVTDVTISAVDILGTAVDWQGSDAETALRVAAQINSNTSSPDYQAVNDGTRVFVWPKAVNVLSASPVTIAAGTNITIGVAGDVTAGNVRTFTGGNAPQYSWPEYDPFADYDYMPRVYPINTAFTFILETPQEAELFLATIADWENSVDREHEVLKVAINAAVDEAAVNAIDVETPYEAYV